MPVKTLKVIRFAAWGAVAAVAGLLLAFGGLFPDKPEIASSTATTTSVAIGSPFELTTHRGETLTNEDLRGKPYLVFFGFTHCPDICPTTLFELTGLLKELGPASNKIVPLFITVDPERDTLDQLASYLSSFDSRIVALRGTNEQTEQVVKAFAAYFKKVPQEGGNYTMDHTTGVYLMDANGQFIGILDTRGPREIQIKKLRRLAESA